MNRINDIMKKYGFKFLITFGIVIILTVLIYIFFIPSYEHMYDIKLIQWHYTIYINEYKAMNESGWDLPKGAYDVTTTKRSRGEDSEGNPKYDTWYEYTINRWAPSRTVVTQGLDREPYWGELNLIPGAEDEVLGSEKEDRRYKVYMVSGLSTESDELVTFAIPEDVWNELTLEDELNYKIKPFSKPYDITIAK